MCRQLAIGVYICQLPKRQLPIDGTLVSKPKFQTTEDILQTRRFKIPITLGIYLHVGDVINIRQIVNA